MNTERFIVSERLLVPNGLFAKANDIACEFKRSINESASQGRLSPDTSVKSLGQPRQTYQDTDNKKREFSGEQKPGVEQNELGYRWEPNEKWEEGKRLYLFPSYQSKNSLDINPNFGWLEPETKNFRNFEEMLKELNKKPLISLSKYKVDPKTDDIDQSSEEVIDSFSIPSGMSFEKRRAQLRKMYNQEYGITEEKRLPGRSLSSLVPGGSLIARAAAAFGVVRDELNKFRCPPGTPAANQFTDMFGSNCFGFSPSRFARFAARKAKEAQNEGQFSGLSNGIRTVMNFIKHGRWDSNVPWAPVRIERNPYYDSITGERLESPDWRTVDVEPGQRVFRNALANAQDEAARFDADVDSVMRELGVDRSEAARATNEDVVEAYEKLRELNEKSGGTLGWDVSIVNASGIDGDTKRMNPEEVRRYITARLEKLPNWQALTTREQERMIDADVKRYYETERAFLETGIRLYKTNPVTAKFFKRIEYNFFTNDEAGTAVEGSMRGGGIYGVMHVNLDKLMTNQELMLPDMRGDERLAVSAIGAISDSAAKLEVADFLINSEYAARHMAGLVDGPKTFTRHVAFHEFSHGKQAQAFMQQILRQALENGGVLEIPNYVDDKRTGRRVVRGMKQIRVGFDEKSGMLLSNLTAGDVMNIMTDAGDKVDLKNISDAMSRIEVASFLAGKYPQQFGEGSELWALEASAELWALREQGLIFGDDVDAAVSWMDDLDARAAAIERGEIDARERAVADAASGTARTDVIPEEEAKEMAKDAVEREIAARREALKAYKESIKNLDEEELVNQAVGIRVGILNSLKEINNLEKELSELKEPAPGSSEGSTDDYYIKLNGIKEEIRKRKMDIESSTKAISLVRSEWRKRYSLGGKKENQKFEDMVKAKMEEIGLVDPDEAKRFAKAKKFDDITKAAETMDEGKMLRRAADLVILTKGKDEDSEEVQDLMAEYHILRKEYAKRAKSAGSGVPSDVTKAGREFDSKVDQLISPKPKKVKKFKSKNESILYAKKEKARHRRRITKEQADAVRKLKDFETPEITQILSPGREAVIGRAINRRNARLMRLSLPIDEASTDEGSLTDQVSNILIPAMEAIDASSVSEPFEMEAIVEFDSADVSGKSLGREVENSNFINGRLSVSGTKPTKLSKSEMRDKETGRVRRRVILTVKAGDRGIFPTAGKGEEQKFIIPPGKIRIIGKEKDGTIRAEISSQKDTIDVVDSLAKQIRDGKDDAIWRKGQAKRIQEISDKTVIDRAARGISRPGTKTDESAEISDTTSDILDEVAESGSVFGESIDVDDVVDEAPEVRPSTPPKPEAPKETVSERFPKPEMPERKKIPEYEASEEKKLSSGVDVFGESQTRTQRRASRRKELGENIREMRSIVGGSGSKLYDDISIDMLDPSVVKAIKDKSPEEIEEILEKAAFRIHTSMDRRVRVRMREEEIDDLAISGKVRAFSSGASEIAPNETQSRRVERLSRMSPIERGQRLSSGRISTVDELAQRKKQEQEVAEKAVVVFDKIVETGKNIDELSDDEISKLFNGSVSRSARKAVSTTNRNTYKVNDIPTALALMALGHHVEVENQNLKLTATAQKSLENEIKKSAARHIATNDRRWLAYKEAYEKSAKEMGLDINSDAFKAKMKVDYADSYQADLCALYSAESNLLCSGNLGIDREKMPQVNGRTRGFNTRAIRMLKAGKAKGKWRSIWARELDQIKDEIKIRKSLGESGDDIKALEVLFASLKESDDRYQSLAKRHNGPGQEGEPLTDAEKQEFYEITDWNDTEANLEDNFIKFLNAVLEPEDPQNGPAVRTRTVPAEEFAPSQQQLVATKVSGMAESIQSDILEISKKLEGEGLVRGTDEFKERFLKEISTKWWTSPILATKDGYILDGHHRWAGIIVANQNLDDALKVGLNVNEVQTDIIEGLTLGRAFQDVYGIKEARLGAENTFVQGDIAEIDDTEILETEEYLMSNIQRMMDELYEKGDLVQVNAVGYTAKPNYKKLVETRRELRSSIRQRAIQVEKELKKTPTISRRLSSGRSSGANGGENRNASIRAASAISKAGIEKQNISEITRAVADVSQFRNGGTSDEIARAAQSLLSNKNRNIGNDVIDALVLAKYIDKNTAKEAKKKLNDLAKQKQFSFYDLEKIPARNKKESKKIVNALVDGLNAYNKKDRKNNKRSVGQLAKLKNSYKLNIGKEQNFDEEAKMAGKSVQNYLSEYHSRIGLSNNLSDELRPVFGYLVNDAQKENKKKSVLAKQKGNTDSNAIFEIQDEDVFGDGLTAYGDIEVVLKPDVSKRTAYGLGDSLSNATRPVMLNSTNREDIVGALSYVGGMDSRKKNFERMHNMIAASETGQYGNINAQRGKDGKFPTANGLFDSGKRDYFEAQILGGFDKDEIEKINYPMSKIEQISSGEDISDVVNNKTIADRLRKAGFTEEEIDYFYSINEGGAKLNTQSMVALRNYRAAQRIREQFKKKGFENVEFAHPNGTNIDDPRSYSRAATRGENVESVLATQISKEVLEQARKMLKDIRKIESPEMVTEVGARS